MIEKSPKPFVQPPPPTEEVEKFRKYITELGKFCRDETFHGEYTGRYEFMDSDHADDTEDSGVKMDIFVNSVYLWFRVRVYPDVFRMYEIGDFKAIGSAMLHEMCHIFIDPISGLFMWDACASQKEHYQNTIERQTERICNSIFFLLPKDWYLPENIVKAEPKS